MSNELKKDSLENYASFHGSAHITMPDDNIFLDLGFSLE